MKIVDVQTGKSLGPNQQGELCLKSSTIMNGYHKNPTATKEILNKNARKDERLPSEHYSSANKDGGRSLPVPIQDVTIELFINIARYEHFLEGVSRHFLKKRRRHSDTLAETMVFLYILAYQVCNLYFEDSVECFDYFKFRKVFFMVSYLLHSETPSVFHRIGCFDFDEDFVEQRLILPLLEATPCLEKLHKNLKGAIETGKHRKKRVTIPVFMNVLNHPKRAAGPPPGTSEDLAVQRFARNIPRTNYVKPSTEKRLATLQAANKSHGIRLLNDANMNAPKLLLHEKRSTEAKLQEKMRPESLRKPIPTFKSIEVKHTTASILRECARVITDEEKEIKKLKMLAEGGFDPSSIVRLEEEERERKKLIELSKVEEKHLLALISREGAFIAKQSLLNGCKQQAECVRKEKQELSEKLEKWKEKHNKEMAEVVERCRIVEQNFRDAFDAMIDEKRQKAAQVSEESGQLKAQLAKQKEEEMQKKIRLIQEIKTIQSLRTLPYKDFDPTESSGLGLLCEMSLAELKERLFWMKMKLNEEIENRKCIVSRERERQKTMIKDTRKALEDNNCS
nr:LOW QUALITY PROTEIN: uncharacterized protein LOC117221567 [Megalopta genalis]